MSLSCFFGYIKISQSVCEFSREKMNIFVLVLTIIAFVSANVIENSIDSNSELIAIKTNYIQGFQKVRKYLNENVHPKAGYYYGIIERSIDIDCVAEKVKKYRLADNLAMLINDEHNDTKKMKNKLGFFYGKPLSVCSNKSHSISNTLFDLIMSFGHIVRAFKDEPELKEFTNYLSCANNYAVEKKLIHISMYTFDYENIDEADKDACHSIKIQLFEQMKSQFKDNADCWEDKVEKLVIKFFLRTLLLLQIKMTPEQNQIELDRFYDDANEMSDEAAICANEFSASDTLKILG